AEKWLAARLHYGHVDPREAGVGNIVNCGAAMSGNYAPSPDRPAPDARRSAGTCRLPSAVCRTVVAGRAVPPPASGRGYPRRP
ncbi:hypothetical protein, partial [Streptomyces sp. NPDC002172]